MTRRVVHLTALMLICIPPLSATAANVDIERIDGVVGGNKIPAGTEVILFFRVFNSFPNNITDLSNGFRIYSTDGAVWHPHAFVDTSIGFSGFSTFDTTFYAAWTDSASGYGQNWNEYFNHYNAITYWEPLLGVDLDTSVFWAIETVGSGFESAATIIPWLLQIDSVSVGSIGKTICIDSSGDRQTAWAWFNGTTTYIPTWDGPYCCEIVADCCEGFRGNINLDWKDTIDISDLTSLVGWMFKSSSAPPCMLEADVNGSGGSLDIADVTYLVNYMFKGGAEPASCG